MALIPVAVTLRSANTAEATWTGTGYVYVDGALVEGAASGSADIPLASEDDVIAVEVHDTETLATYHEPEIRPLLWWRAVSGAEYYRIYHTAPGASETLILEREASSADPETEPCPTDLADGWHQFRIEAVGANGLESTGSTEQRRIYDIPSAPSDVSMTGSGGTFTLTVTD